MGNKEGGVRSRNIFSDYSSILPYLIRILDMLAIVVTGFIAYWLPSWPAPLDLQVYQIAILFGTLLVAIIFPLFGLYRSWRGQSHITQFQAVASAWMMVVILLIIIAFLTKTSTLYSRQWMVLWGFLGLAFLFALRAGMGRLVHYLRMQGWNHKKVIIVGAGPLGQSVAQQLQVSHGMGFDIVAFLDDNPALHGQQYFGINIAGDLGCLPAMVEQHEVDEVWITLPLGAESRLKELLHVLRHSTVNIRFVPDIFSLQLINHSVSEIAGLPVLNLSESPMYGINEVIKYVEDKVISLIFLIVFSPLMLMIAIGVKLSSRGPVLYRQERVGWNGKPFQMYKFRTMPLEVEAASGPVWAQAGELRATAFGALLRRVSLDELPQFFNVLKGEMSIVGPRPERPMFVGQFKDKVPDYMKKHLVKAGITGLAQIHGWRGSTDINRRIEWDIAYIENWSLWLDIKIMFLTLFKGFVNKNAY